MFWLKVGTLIHQVEFDKQLDLVLTQYSTDKVKIFNKTREQPVPEIKQMLCLFLSESGFQYENKYLAKYLKTSESNVSHLLKKAKELFSIDRNFQHTYFEIKKLMSSNYSLDLK